MADTALQKEADRHPGAGRGDPRRDLHARAWTSWRPRTSCCCSPTCPASREDDVDIRFESGELTLHARRAPATATGGLLWENEVGDFFRAFRISEQMDAGKIWAELKHGVLTLHLPKVEAAKPRKIAVRGG